MLQDIAVLTKGTVVSPETGISLEKAELAHLGHAKRVEVDKDQCTIIGGSGDAAALANRIAQVKGEIEKTSSDYERQRLEGRVAKLSGGVAVMKVGAATETEMKERKARFEDALHATRAAIAEGILPGGGVSLLRARAALSNLKASNDDENCGIKIVLRAVEEPLRQLVENAGRDPSVVLDRVLSGKGNFGYNAASGEYGDLVAMGVVDPCKVTRTAIQNAASIAGLILTTDCMVARIPQPPAQAAIPRDV
jgi:chaperonin GroEL